MLNLAPETENLVREAAAREGIDADTFINRLLQKETPSAKANLLAMIHAWQAEDATDDEQELKNRDHETRKLQAALDESRKQAGMRTLFESKD